MNAALWLASALFWCAAFSGLALAQDGRAEAVVQQAGEQAELIDLNDASATELTKLPGIGPKRAEAIVTFREQHGGFRSVAQLLRIKGIGRAMLRKLRPLVTVTAAAPETPVSPPPKDQR